MTVSFSARQLGWMMFAVGLFNTVVWLDSLDKYLDARFQWSLSSQLPDSWLAPSRRVGQWLAPQANQGPQGQPVDAASVWQMPTPMRPFVPTPAAGAFWETLAVQKLAAGPQRILFAGDSMMQGVAPLAIRALSQSHPDWQMTDLSRQSTGITSRRYFDWPLKIRQETDTQKLTLVVLFLGPNDPRDMYLPDKRVSFDSPEWLENYAARVDEILAHAVQNQVRVIWLGLPAMREERLQRGAEVSNYVFHDRARVFGTDYLSTEPLIGLVSLPFKKFMRDETGRSVSLRGEDGTHFTPAGLKIISQALVDHIEKAHQP
jgi:hypothetical protein